jgi:nickel-dependent lactate racemase
MVIGYGNEAMGLSMDQAREIMAEAFSELDVDGKKVLILIPDRTRSAPIPMFFELFYELIGDRVEKLDYLIALGTHQPLDEENIAALVGADAEERANRFPKVDIYNHEWNDPDIFVNVGTITEEETDEITGGLLAADVPVELNKRIYDYDQLIICGPTFPHEVVGFSGGYKYLFPGIAGPDIINFFHWLGAVMTSRRIIGTKDTPVRAVLNRAADFVDVPVYCFSFAMKGNEFMGLYAGHPLETFDAAADLSAKINIVYVEEPFKRVLSIAAEMYDDIWTAAKAMYKLEPAIEEGGEVVVYAPHIDEISYTHGELLDQVGYHVRDYFMKQWTKFEDYPGGVLAHSTHLKGDGVFEDGEEKPRINVVLATGIPEERVRQINLDYMDPDEVDIKAWEGREDEGIKVVHHAGEMLYRLNSDKGK